MDSQMQRRSAIAPGVVAAIDSSNFASAAVEQDKSPVFFTRDISVSGLLKIYAKISEGMTGTIAIVKGGVKPGQWAE